MQASAIEQSATEVSGATDVSYAAGSTVIVVADRAGHGEWQGRGRAAAQAAFPTRSSAIVLCAGGSQRELVERGVGEYRYSAQRLFGSAPEALPLPPVGDRA
jgi:hypothetical protein